MRCTWIAFFVIAQTALVATATGCDNSCDPNQTQVPVRERNSLSSNSNEFVCVPDEDESTTTVTPTASNGAASTSDDAGITTNDASAASDATTSADSTTSACAAITVLGPVVLVVAKSIEPPVTNVAPANGAYTLVQASSYAVDGGAPTLSLIGATLDVNGAALRLGALTPAPSLEENESFTLTLAAGALTTVCETRAGSLAALLPAPGGTEPADLSWDPIASVLTLRIHAATGDVDLLFEPM